MVYELGLILISSDMRMKDPIPTYSYVIKTIKDLYPSFAYISVCEPRVVGSSMLDANIDASDSNDFIRDIWSPKPLIVAGGFDRESAIERADSTGDLIAFGRRYISNVSVYHVMQVAHC